MGWSDQGAYILFEQKGFVNVKFSCDAFVVLILGGIARHNELGQLTVHQCIFLAHVEEHFQPHAEGTGAHLAALLSARSNHMMKHILVTLLGNLQKFKR